MSRAGARRAALRARGAGGRAAAGALSLGRSLALIAALGCSADQDDFVGTARCASCHQDEFERWRGSHHDLAMQKATAQTVLGDFSGTEFFRRDDRYFARAEAADGVLRDFEVEYTFGAVPLQQYLVRLPGGRLQALTTAWDSRPADAGGQRWFSLYPGETIAHDDVLHWTGRAFNWNDRCAACHSTNVSKGYDLQTGTYDTRWSEIDVGCEACHGPGSQHAQAASRSENATPLGLANSTELEACAPCHSRRSALHGDHMPGRAFLDGYRPALLEPGLYFADGQIRDEVYVWGSFLQSRKHAAGVTCSNCHDPHALRIEEPDRTCDGCHLPQVYATREHHRHTVGSTGSSCVECHMPARTYMVVDDRRDHSFRVPRPDRSAELGTPNACTDGASGCHVGRPAKWAAGAIASWELRGLPPVEPPAIVRASALLRSPDTHAVLQGLRDADPLVRMAAANGARARGIDVASSLLADPFLAVRLAALQAKQAFTGSVPRSAFQEYEAVQRANADQPESHMNLGVVHAQFGELAEARREYETALRLGPSFVPAYVNLADLDRVEGRDDRGERVLRTVLQMAPRNADVHHALGLLLVRQKRLREAVGFLDRAAELAPDNERYAYVSAAARDGLE